MGKILYGVILVVALSVVVNSLKCNQCSYGLLGFCLSSSELVCSTNTSVCYTGKATFTGLSSVGFNSQGCREPSGCNATMNSTLVGVDYQTRIDCCSTDKCNPVSSAPAPKMTFAAIIGAAILASAWGSLM
ncbi:unnamed protein product [Tetraodon nigroviridis]|uniref:(spotted green pufferfish) hypothetical protein n=1 Tax=Tetraodon nigroviridis TaxID=99883 RepID=Q4SZK5_TETNG|nr:unnamed protein product [Tetraodon nigroviridis]